MPHGDVLWLGYDGIHSAHRDFAASIDADVMNLTIDHEPGWTNLFRYVRKGVQLGDYDYIICNEGPSMRSGVAKKLESVLKPHKKNTKLIRYLANANYFFITQNDPDGKRPFVNKHLSRLMDGGIANSSFTKKYGSQFIDGPIKVVNPPIGDELYEKLGKNDVDHGSRRILSVGFDHRVKGTDILIEAFNDTKNNIDNLKLMMVGKGREKYDDRPHVQGYGHHDDIENFYSQADLYVQPSRGDGFAVVVIEAMRAGIPPIVTKYTGAKEIVEKLDPKLIREPTSKDIAEGIKYYYNLPINRRKKLSKEAKELSKEFRTETKKKEFKTAFESLIDEI